MHRDANNIKKGNKVIETLEHMRIKYTAKSRCAFSRFQSSLSLLILTIYFMLFIHRLHALISVEIVA